MLKTVPTTTSTATSAATATATATADATATATTCDLRLATCDLRHGDLPGADHPRVDLPIGPLPRNRRFLLFFLHIGINTSISTSTGIENT